MKYLLLMKVLTGVLWAGPYAPAANREGTTAVTLTDERISHWAGSVFSYSPGEEVDSRWQETSQALGAAEGAPFDIVSLGRGGEIVLEFDPPIQDFAGDDFAVFENSFAHTFLELAFVEVSNDGVNFQRFETDSLTATAVAEFGNLDTTDVTGFAGKYIGGTGTPFDLADLNLTTARYVKLVDVVGGSSLDSSGDVIFDPWPTAGSAGFDLDGIAVLNSNPSSVIPRVEILFAGVEGNDYVIKWQAVVGERYLIQSSEDLVRDWELLEEREATSEEEEIKIPLSGFTKRFFRIGIQREK